MISHVGTYLRSLSPPRTALVLALGAACLWAYWPTLTAMGHRWLHDPQYSHAYLVPVFACWLLWWRRAQMPAWQAAPCWGGLALLALGILLRLAGTYAYFDWIEGISLLPCLAGLATLLLGRGALRWAWPALAFLLFMLPLPYRAETALSHPLQGIATKGSAYLMQTLGMPALAEGNTILLSRSRIGVAEACNGLSMMLVFFAFATAVVIVVKRPLLDKAIILLSAPLVAVAANIGRITATGAAVEWVSPELGEAIFHDWAGWLMMPLALGLLAAELWLLSRILVPRREAEAPPALFPQVPGAAPAPPAKRQGTPSRQGVPIIPAPRPQ